MLSNPIATAVGTGNVEHDEVLTFPMSSGQRRLWFLCRAEPDSAAYNVPTCLRLRGPLDVPLLGCAITSVARRHESLRTTFGFAGGEPVQFVHRPQDVMVGAEHVPGRDLAEREERALDLARQEAGRPFDLQIGPVFRVRLWQLAPEDHLLLVTLHHIACDGWSIGVLFGELTRVYGALVAGREPSLPDLPIQYADFAVWEQRYLAGSRATEALAYWTQQLAGSPSVMNLPLDRPRSARPSSRGGVVTRQLGRDLVGRVTQLADRFDTTPYVVFLALFAAVLHRYSGDTDIVIGSPAAHRDRVELESVIGFLVNTIALRLSFAGDPSAAALIEQARTTVLDALDHQDAPFETVVRALDPDRGGGSMPLVQVMLGLQRELRDPPSLPGIATAVVDIENGTSKFDLTLELFERRGAVRARLEYNRDLFERDTVARLLHHFERALDSAAADSSQAISRLPILAPAERREILEDWNRTTTSYPRDESIHALVEAQVARRPGAIAVVDGARSVTYAELNLHAEAIAARLRRLGVTPGTLVGVCLPRSIEFVGALLGVLKAGGVYVPLDPSHPRDRLAALLDDAEARVVIAGAPQREVLPPGLLVVDADAGADGETEPDRRSPEPPTVTVPRVGGDDPAYVIYTSGSTGKPKGVTVPHRAIARLVLNTNYIALSVDDVVGHFSNVAFDAATFEVWGALLCGATIAVISRDVALSPRRLATEFERAGITTLFLTAALFNQIAREEPTVFSRLRHLLVGGDACDPRAVAAVVEHGRPAHLLNAYGPTETTTFAATFEVGGVGEIATTVPIGRPISNTTLYVLDRYMAPVPVGVAGELYIGGDGVACGYHRQPALTAARFVPDPFAQAPGAKLYRTGDRVRYRADGNIEFLGRLDDQVKIRGFRVEPGEVEARLLEHQALSQATALAERDEAGLARLIAYVARREGALVSPADLRAFLKQALPDYMVPSEILILDTLPINANGKVDRTALRALTPSRMVPSRDVVLPRDPLEAILAQIWEDLLEVRPIGITDDFFELGGHSLLAAKMMDEAERAVGRRLPLSVLMEGPTVETLANAFFHAERDGETRPLVRIKEAGSRRPFFFLHGDLNGGGLYCINLARHLDPERPLVALQPLGLDGNSPPRRIEAMASVHLQTLRETEPHGPYLLGGFCHGGLIAYEMARRLRAEGEDVRLVAIIHASAANARLRRVEDAIRYWARWRGTSDAAQMRAFLRALAFAVRLHDASGLERLTFLLAKRRKLREVLERMTGRRNGHHGVEPAPEWSDAPIASRRHAPEIFSVYANAVDAYVPRRYDGPVALLLPGEAVPPARLTERERDWRRVARALDVRVIDGEHRTCITTHVVSLAAALDDCLNAADPQPVAR